LLQGYGEVQYNDFLEYYAKRFYDPLRNEEQETREAFKMFDLNGDGYIDLQELKTVMTNMGEESLSDAEFKEMIKYADIDFDGKVNYEGKLFLCWFNFKIFRISVESSAFLIITT
jgi:calmodulin